MNKKGFTLIEIIIVIVILGVLATLALPRLAAQVDAAEAAEAMQFFGAIKRSAMSCYDASGNFATCATAAQLSVTVPASSKFTYFHSGPDSTSTTVNWYGQAKRNTANYILMQVDQTGKTLMATNTNSPFIGIINKVGASTAIVGIGTATF